MVILKDELGKVKWEFGAEILNSGLHLNVQMMDVSRVVIV